MVTIAAVQMSCSESAEENRKKALKKIGEAAEQGAQIILLPELFEGPYFCKTQKGREFARAFSWEEHPGRADFEAMAREKEVVLPISFFEKAGKAYFNSVAVIDADGKTLGIYRKNHIPQGPGYEEKFYFSPGDLGLKVWETAYARIGVGICWDQWFPEAARAMSLMGAELLFYPTAIGSEPETPELDSSEHWQTVQRGHAGANMVPLTAANRIGTESQDGVTMTFYGSSFIAGARAEFQARADKTEETILTASFDLKLIEQDRAEWGLLRDRRPENYTRLMSY